MIPKKIHYCWFGHSPLPKSAEKCIASWRKFFPDYEIIEWNEDNYDVRKIPYIAQAYDAKKYAFVSDYARFDILYQHGGVYFDTDVEVIRSFDDVLERGAFMGCEIDGLRSAQTEQGVVKKSVIAVAPGLGLGATQGLQLYKDILGFYAGQQFFNPDGSLNTKTVVKYTTEVLMTSGLLDTEGIQKVGDITVYPAEYFNPLDSVTGQLNKTENTHSIHWYTASWMSPKQRLRSKITRPFHRIFGADCFAALKKKK